MVFPHNTSLSTVQSGRIRFDLFSQLDTSRRHTTTWTPKILRPLEYLAISTLPSTASLSKINSRSQFFTGQYQLSLCRSYDVCHVESAIVRLVFPTVKRIDALFIATPIRNSDHELQKPGSIVNFKYLLALNLHSLGLSSPRIRLG